MGVERVVSTRVKSDIRGLGTAGRDFRVGSGPLSRVERHTLRYNGIAHSRIAGHSKTLADNQHGFTWTVRGGQSVRTGSDQHQPASSRAMAALATTERFLRASKLTHR